MRYAHFLKKDGVIVVNDHRIDPMTVVTGAMKYPENIIEKLKENHEVIVIDGLRAALSLGNSKVLNSVVLGAAAEKIGFSVDTWLSVLENTVPEKTKDINRKAFLHGFSSKN